MVLSRRSRIQMPAAVRVASYAVWDTVVFLLNALAFIVVGMQLGPITGRLDHARHVQYQLFALAIVATVIFTRIAWVFAYNGGLWLLNHALGAHTPTAMKPRPFKGTLLVAWCGMRGMVTLAACLGLPDGSGGEPAFPYRDLIVLTAFSVVLGTLVVQGLTLRPFLGLLKLEPDETVENEIRAGRAELMRSALASWAADDTEAAVMLRGEYMELLWQLDGSGGPSAEIRKKANTIRNAAHHAARQSLDNLRRSGAIGDLAFRILEAELDTIKLDIETRSRW
jgi:CPA1 family monovalent cation:H+ antiporter